MRKLSPVPDTGLLDSDFHRNGGGVRESNNKEVSYVAT